MGQTMQGRRYGLETARPKSPPAGARAIGGVRVSAVGERDADTATSAPEQREWARWECERRGLQFVGSEEDLSVPGDVWEERRGLWAAVEAIEDGRAEVLMFQNTKRLAREIELGAHVLRRVEAAGGWLVIGDCPDGAPKAMFALMLGQGQDDHEEKKAYMRAAKIAAVDKGVNVGKVPFGYVRGEGGRLEIDLVRAAVVRELFELRAAGGSWRELGALFLLRTGRPRAQAALAHMLANRKYLGTVWFEELENTEAHEAIVSEELFQAANRPRRGPAPRRGPGVKSLLAGIARCGTCGGPLNSTISGTKKYPIRVYKCVQGRLAGICDAPVMANEAKVDAIALADVWDWLEGRGEADRLYTVTDEAEISAAKVELEAAEADATMWAAESIGLPAEAIRAGSQARAARIEELAGRLGELEAANQITAARITLRQLWPTLERDELRYLLGEIGLLVRVTRAPRGTELRHRVETIVGGRFAAAADDEIDGPAET